MPPGLSNRQVIELAWIIEPLNGGNGLPKYTSTPSGGSDLVHFFAKKRLFYSIFYLKLSKKLLKSKHKLSKMKCMHILVKKITISLPPDGSVEI